MSGYFTRLLPVHIAAFAALAVMFIQDTDFLGGRAAVMIAFAVQMLALAFHLFAWLRQKKISFPAMAIFVVLSLFGPLYTFGLFSLFVFDTYDNPLIQAVPPVAAIICLILMWLAFSPPKQGS